MRAVILLLAVAALVIGGTVQALDGAWASPAARAIRQVGTASPGQHEPGFLYNLDCTLLTFRLRDSTSLETGCFAPTGFGWLDADSDIAIFNGTDEGQRLIPYAPHQSLAPWPQSGGLISLVPDSIQGDYVGLYRSPVSELRDE